MSGDERQALFSEPPEHDAGDELDGIGLHHDPHRKGSDRVASRLGLKGSKRRPEAGSGSGRSDRRGTSVAASRSQRERQKMAAAKLKKLVPVAVLAGLALLIAIGFLIPGWITGSYISRLESTSAARREEAAHALATSKRGADQLLVRLQHGKPDGSAGAAAVALAKSGPLGLERLRTAASSQKPETRLAAARGLGLTRSPGAVETLASMLASDGDKAVRIEAARALGMIRAPAAVTALVGQAEAESEIRAAVVDSVLTAACAAARDQLIAGMGSPGEEMRTACARALMATGQEALIPEPEMIKLFSSDRAEVRAGVLRLLQYRPDTLFGRLIGPALEDKSDLVQATAAEAAALRGHFAAAEALEKLAEDKESKPRAALAAIRALGKVGRRLSTLVLTRIIVDPLRQADLRQAAAEALGELASRLKFVRLTAQGEINDEGTHLKLSLKDPDPRWEALRILCDGCESFGGEKLSAAAFEAMRQLSGRKLAPKPEVWKPWMEKKRADALLLGEASQMIEKAAALGRAAYAEAGKCQERAREISDELIKTADAEDWTFYENLWRTLHDPKAEPPKKGPASPPPSAPPAGGVEGQQPAQ